MAQGYTTDHVKGVAAMYRGHRRLDDIPSEVLQQLYKVPFEAQPGDVDIDPGPVSHEYFILRSGKDSAQATFDSEAERLRRVDRVEAYGIHPRNAEQTFALDALLDRDIPLVTISGKAGTGKTQLADMASDLL